VRIVRSFAQNRRQQLSLIFWVSAWNGAGPPAADDRSREKKKKEYGSGEKRKSTQKDIIEIF
jgi:hypothetical protein